MVERVERLTPLIAVSDYRFLHALLLVRIGRILRCHEGTRHVAVNAFVTVGAYFFFG